MLNETTLNNEDAHSQIVDSYDRWLSELRKELSTRWPHAAVEEAIAIALTYTKWTVDERLAIAARITEYKKMGASNAMARFLAEADTREARG